METMHELIPFAKEMLRQKPNRKMVKIYLLGSVLAFFGVVIGLVETVVSPFTSGHMEEDEEEEQRAPAPLPAQSAPQKKQEVALEKGTHQVIASRNLANRGHAS